MDKNRIIIIAVLVALFTVLHYMTPLTVPSLHIVYRELYFVPIILAAIWGGKKGGLITGIAVSLIYIPHVFFLAEPHPSFDPNMMLMISATSAESLWGNLFQILFFNLVGFFLGLMIENVEKEHRARIKSERLAAIGNTVAEIAHDMKAPLMAIGGFSTQLAKSIDETDENSRKKLGIVIRETGRLEAMVKEMLDFARPLELNLSSVNLNHLTSESAGVAQSFALDAGLTLQTELERSIPPLMLDRIKMRQVILNLITNAIQACKTGDRVTVKTRFSGRSAYLDVIDCGPGIPVEQEENIFQPYFSTKKDGTGLGLANVKKIVEGHGGTVSFRSNSPQGTIFTIEFKVSSNG
ncbi:MAG: GHKL domain-containing protein [Deltaproteobacteria bacterium]|nr:GHKL domain-containing protein [Deltaproteobacteria bacterium]